MLLLVDTITIRQLSDCAAAVFTKKQKYCQSKIFSCKLKFVIDLLKKWLAENFFNRFKELDRGLKDKIQLIGNQQTVSYVIFAFPSLPLIFQAQKNYISRLCYRKKIFFHQENIWSGGFNIIKKYWNTRKI